MNRIIANVLTIFVIASIIASCSEDSIPVQAPSGVIRGEVFAVPGNWGVDSVSITTQPPTSSLLTDSLGKFLLTGLDPGEYLITASKDGFRSYYAKAVVANEKETSTRMPLVLNLATPDSCALKLIDSSNSSNIIRASYRDTTDGNSSIVDTLFLQMGKTYDGSIALFNLTDSTVFDLMPEITQQRNSYRFFYTPDSSIADSLEILSLNLDSYGLIFGSTFKVQVHGGQSMGQLNIKLRYYNTGVKYSEWHETDLNIDFPVVIRQ